MDSSQNESISKFLIRHNSVFVLVFSIIVATLMTYIAYIVTGHGEIILLIPFTTLAIMYWLKLRGTKQRLLAGVIIFLAAGIIAAGIASTSYYSTSHPATYQMPNGGIATLSVDPFGGVNESYNFSMVVTNLSSPSLLSASLNVSSGAVAHQYQFSQMNHLVLNNNTVLVYKNVRNLPQGIYSYNFTIANGSSPIVLSYIGPVVSGNTILFVYLIPSFAYDFVVPNILIFTALVFIARSMERSRSYIDTIGKEKK